MNELRAERARNNDLDAVVGEVRDLEGRHLDLSDRVVVQVLDGPLEFIGDRVDGNDESEAAVTQVALEVRAEGELVPAIPSRECLHGLEEGAA
jgi:hypothetical protein